MQAESLFEETLINTKAKKGINVVDFRIIF